MGLSIYRVKHRQEGKTVNLLVIVLKTFPADCCTEYNCEFENNGTESHLSNCILMRFQFQHKVLVVVESSFDCIQVLLAEAVEGHEMVLGLQEPTQHLLEDVCPGVETGHLVLIHPPRRRCGGGGELGVSLNINSWK